MSTIIGKRIEIDESNFKSFKTLKAIDENDIVCLRNKSKDEDIETDDKALCDYLKTLEGAEKVNTLRIEWSSSLKNVEIIRAFPNLRFLEVYGHKIISLDGLEWFRGEYIGIDTEKKQKCNIEKITHIPIPRMCLNNGQKTGLEAIGKCLSLTWLELSNSPSPEFSQWKNVPLEYLKLMQCKFNELRDIGCLKSLDHLMVAGCRNFEKFSGDNNRVRILTISVCKHFDLYSLNMIQGLEYVSINQCAREIALSDLPEHPTIRRLGLHECKINADLDDIKKKMPKLEKIFTDKISKEFV